MRRITVICLVIVAMALASSCGSSPPSTDTSTKKIAITITRDSVTPNGERVDVAVGQLIELDVNAEAAGQLHVHSDPDHTFDYKAGTTSFTFAIDRPGIVDVESHDLNKIIVQLRVQ